MKYLLLKISTVLLFGLSTLLGIGLLQAMLTAEGKIENKFLIYLMLALPSVVFYIAGIIVTFISNPKLGKSISFAAGGLSILSLILAIMWFIDGAVVVWQIYMLPGLIAAMILLAIHKKKVTSA